MPLEDDTEPYVIQELDSGAIYELMKDKISFHNPNSNPHEMEKCDFPHMPWIRHNAKVTLYLNDKMKEPKQGTLIHTNSNWYFHQGRTKKHPPLHLPNFHEVAVSLVQNKKLFQGWLARQRVLAARIARSTSNMLAHLIYCRKVSASSLINMNAPTSLLKHHIMHPSDKITWDASYKSEYDGLVDIDTWE